MSEEMRHSSGPWGSRMRWVLIGFSLIGGFFLIAEHRAHVLPYLPWLLLAACPLMHLFGHGGHGHGGHGGDSNGGERPSGGSAESSARARQPTDAVGKPGGGEPTESSGHRHHHGEG